MDESRFLIDNEYGRNAFETVMNTIIGYKDPLVSPPKFKGICKGDIFSIWILQVDYPNKFLRLLDLSVALVRVGLLYYSKTSPKVLTLDKDYRNISIFLNRILGLPFIRQKQFVRYFTDILLEIIEKAKKSGYVEIVDLVRCGANIKRNKLHTFTTRHLIWTNLIEMHTIEVENSTGGKRMHYVLSGSVLPVWTKIKSALDKNKQQNNQQVSFGFRRWT